MDKELSEIISEFLELMGQIQEQYSSSIKEVQRLERLTQDYLHLLELQENNYHERARIATQLGRCRVQRRPYKDEVMLLEPLVKYLETSKGKAMLAQLQHICTLLRNAEKMVQCRKYIPRVMTRAEYEKKRFDEEGKGTPAKIPLEVETLSPIVDGESKGEGGDEKC